MHTGAATYGFMGMGFPSEPVRPQAPRRSQFKRRLVIVASGHSALVLALLVIPLVFGLFRSRKTIEIPTQFMVEIAVDPAARKGVYEVGSPARTEPKVVDKPEPKRTKPETILKEEKKPEVKPKETKKPPKPKDTKKPEPSKPPKQASSPSTIKPLVRPKLSPDDIRRLLEKNAVIAAKPSLPDDLLRRLKDMDGNFGNGPLLTEDMAYMELVRLTMYKVWEQPTSLPANGLVTKVEIFFGANGAVTGSRKAGGSGNATMDDSVMRAVEAVRRIPGLPASFISKHPSLIVEFELTDKRI